MGKNITLIHNTANIYLQFLQLASFLNKDEIAKAIGDLKNAFQPKTPKSNRKRKRGENDVVHFKVQIPIERRQSARLSKLPAEFHYTDLPEEVCILWHPGESQFIFKICRTLTRKSVTIALRT